MPHRAHPPFLRHACWALVAAGGLGCRPSPTSDAPSTAPPAEAPPGRWTPAAAPPAAVRAITRSIDPARLRAIVERLAGFETRHTLSDTASEVRGIGAARRWIEAELRRATAHPDRSGDRTVTVALDPHLIPADGRRIRRDTEVVNVVATIPGDLPAARDQYVYVIAHYDSRAKDVMDPEAPAPGANDDASGVAVVLELARVLAPHRFDATIILMATAGEEQGLVGARAHARAAKAAGRQVRAVLNNDIVGDPTSPDGRRTDRVIRLFSATLPPEPAAADYARLRELSGVHDSPSRAVARHLGEIAAWEATTVQPVLIFRHDRFLRGGDHTAFADEGFPAVRFCEVDEDYARQHEDPRTENGVAYGDTAQWVDAQYLAGVAILNATAAIHLANAPATPSGARIDTRELSNTTTVRWDANVEPDLAGYEVLWRETTSAVWQHARDVGIATSVTLPISKDDHFFGVRAYDRDGYRSVAAFPGVER